MTDRQNVTVNVSCALTGFDEAREALDSLTKSAEAAAKALDDLGARPHGGIIVKVVGALAQVEIKPVA